MDISGCVAATAAIGALAATGEFDGVGGCVDSNIGEALACDDVDGGALVSEIGTRLSVYCPSVPGKTSSR